MEAAARYYHARDYAEAERCCRELIEQDARHFDALHLLGVVCLDRAQFADAVGYLTRAVRERRSRTHRRTTIWGPHCSGRSCIDQAEAALRLSLAARPDDAGALNNLGNALAQPGASCGGIWRASSRCCGRSRDTLPAHYNMGRSLAELDRLEDAVASFPERSGRRARRHRPGSAGRHPRGTWPGIGRVWDATTKRWQPATRSQRSGPGVAAWNESLVLLLLRQLHRRVAEIRGPLACAGSRSRRVQDARVPALTEVAGKRVLLIARAGTWRHDPVRSLRAAAGGARCARHACRPMSN